MPMFVIDNDTLAPLDSLDPLRELLIRNVMRYEIGKRLGQCPVTKRMGMDYRTAVIIIDADGDPLLTVSPEGLAELRARQMRPGVRIASLRRRSLPVAGRKEGE